MARLKSTPNAKPVQIVRLNPFNLIRGLLIFVGKPFYFIFSYIIIGLLFVFYTVGRIVRTLATNLYDYLTRPIAPAPKVTRKAPPSKLFVGARLPAFKFPQLKIRIFPKKTFRLYLLRIQLFWLKISRRFIKPIRKFARKRKGGLWPRLTTEIKIGLLVFFLLLFAFTF